MPSTRPMYFLFTALISVSNVFWRVCLFNIQSSHRTVKAHICFVFLLCFWGSEQCAWCKRCSVNKCWIFEWIFIYFAVKSLHLLISLPSALSSVPPFLPLNFSYCQLGNLKHNNDIAKLNCLSVTTIWNIYTLWMSENSWGKYDISTISYHSAFSMKFIVL